jgi:2-polyprenyl-3-methyl-5-hydroxy-6-metoxy-1,4-benzoquinol methylase
VCSLIFADPSARLTPDEEKRRYDQHQNNPDDPGYRRFLNRLAVPLIERLRTRTSPQEGLDFGCGPGPTLSLMLQEQGFSVKLYDPYYAPTLSVLSSKYDFVTCTEAVEHFFHPAKEWELFMKLLKPGGWLGLMTKLADGNPEGFLSWHYTKDPTHVSFLSRDTFRWLAERNAMDLEFVGDDVILLRKRAS